MSLHGIRHSLSFIDSWLEFHAKNDGIPGFAVAVEYKGKSIFSKAYGLSDIARQTPLTADSLFNTGSQAKMYTAVAIMQLAQNGVLSLDEAAVTYLPWIKKHKEPAFQHINIRQLLWHGAGLIRDGNQADYWQLLKPFPDQRELQQLVLSSTLAIGRGDTLKYSDLGYALLGEIIAAASGGSYAQYIKKHIVQPLGLVNTFVDLSPTVTKRLATSYTPLMEGRRIALPSVPAHTFDAVAGLYMTTNDACAFLSALFDEDDRLLDKRSKQQLLTDRRRHWAPGKADATDYSLGLMFVEVCGNSLVGHSGSFLGYRSAVFADPNHKIAVSVMTTAKDAPVLDMCFGIFDTLYYFTEHADRPATPQLQKFNIRLRNLWSALQIVATNGQVVAIYPDEWFPFSRNVKALSIVDDSTLRIDHDHDLMSPGELIRFTWKNRRVTHVNFAGITMVPEAALSGWLKAQKLQ